MTNLNSMNTFCLKWIVVSLPSWARGEYKLASWRGVWQGKYIEELQTNSLLVLAICKPNLGCSSPTGALITWYGLFLTSLPKRPTSLLNMSVQVTPLYTLLGIWVSTAVHCPVWMSMQVVWILLSLLFFGKDKILFEFCKIAKCVRKATSGTHTTQSFWAKGKN